MSELQAIERGWDRAAVTDPFFNILTVHGLGRPEFWETGRQEIVRLLRQLPPIHAQRTALDFGCGVGRLTQALACDYLEVHGVDVSSEMIRLANEHNQRSSVRYHHNPAPDLALFEDTFDLVFSLIVLQHMPSQLAGGYVREFLRVTRPGGHVVFQIPEGSGHAVHPDEWLSIYSTPRSEIEEWLDGATVLDVMDDGACGPGFSSRRYIVQAS